MHQRGCVPTADGREAEVLMLRAPVLGWIAMLAIAAAAGLLWGSRSAEPLPQTTVDLRPAPAESSDITVHVAGWVASPGLVVVPEGSRVADAVAAAGGLLPGAVVETINLAAPITDGEQIVVSGPADRGTLAGGQSSDGKIHLNRADAAELETLPGVGPVLAQRIIEYRDEYGPFAAVEDLLDVPGIGEAKLASLRDLIVVP
ncbi:MAG: ComEA family DNA-binding protein [Actinomycetota bacterium]